MTHNHYIDGRSGERLWVIWWAMRGRCGTQEGYQHVSVCAEWLDYPTFKAWAIENGYRDPESGAEPRSWLTIDRIEARGNYEPSNCRWISKSANSARARVSALSDGMVERMVVERLQGSTYGDIAERWGFHDSWVRKKLRGRVPITRRGGAANRLVYGWSR